MTEEEEKETLLCKLKNAQNPRQGAQSYNWKEVSTRQIINTTDVVKSQAMSSCLKFRLSREFAVNTIKVYTWILGFGSSVLFHVVTYSCSIVSCFTFLLAINLNSYFNFFCFRPKRLKSHESLILRGCSIVLELSYSIMYFAFYRSLKSQYRLCSSATFMVFDGFKLWNQHDRTIRHSFITLSIDRPLDSWEINKRLYNGSVISSLLFKTTKNHKRCWAIQLYSLFRFL